MTLHELFRTAPDVELATPVLHVAPPLSPIVAEPDPRRAALDALTRKREREQSRIVASNVGDTPLPARASLIVGGILIATVAFAAGAMLKSQPPPSETTDADSSVDVKVVAAQKRLEEIGVRARLKAAEAARTDATH